MPDIRVRSAGAAGAYAFQPITAAGLAFVQGFAERTPGAWDAEGTYWFRERVASPYEVLKDCMLDIVSGVGSDDACDRPWRRG